VCIAVTLLPVGEPVASGVGDVGGTADEEVVDRLDGAEFDVGPVGGGGGRVGGRGELVVLWGEHQHGDRRRIDPEHRQRGSDRDDSGNALIDGGERDGGPERVADHGERSVHPLGQFVECGDHVEPFVDPAPELGPEVEAQRREAERGEEAEHCVDDRVEPVAAVLRVRMAHDDTATGGPGRGGEIRRETVSVGGGQRYGLHVGDGTLVGVSDGDQKLPIKMLNDRLLVKLSKEDGERKTGSGILIPATAQMSKRLVWAEVVALGPNVRSAEIGDNVLFSPDDRYEVEVGGDDYIMLRERDLHAVAAKRIEASTGLYL
jgi:chaperonin GroES